MSSAEETQPDWWKAETMNDLISRFLYAMARSAAISGVEQMAQIKGSRIDRLKYELVKISDGSVPDDYVISRMLHTHYKAIPTEAELQKMRQFDVNFLYWKIEEGMRAENRPSWSPFDFSKFEDFETVCIECLNANRKFDEVVYDKGAHNPRCAECGARDFLYAFTDKECGIDQNTKRQLLREIFNEALKRVNTGWPKTLDPKWVKRAEDFRDKTGLRVGYREPVFDEDKPFDEARKEVEKMFPMSVSPCSLD